MITNLFFIALSLLLLFFGADSLVKGSASLALRAGLSRLLVGLTIVAFGTSTPELVVSIKAALSQQGDIAVANVIGSNSFNIGVILGLTALIYPIAVNRQILRIDAPIALAIAILLYLLLLDQTLGRIEGVVLLAGIIAYTWMNVVLAGKASQTETIEHDDPAIKKEVMRHWGLDILLIVGGLVVLVAGSNLLIDHSVALAKTFDISEAVIGITIVAAGTSMPELATSLVAALRRELDIAIGNVIGSNVFNILGILGLSAVVSPVYAPGLSTLDYAAMILFTALLIPLLYTGRLLHRLEGGLLLALYAAYLFILWP